MKYPLSTLGSSSTNGGIDDVGWVVFRVSGGWSGVYDDLRLSNTSLPQY